MDLIKKNIITNVIKKNIINIFNIFKNLNKSEVLYLFFFFFTYKTYNHFKNKQNILVSILYSIPYLNTNIKSKLYKQTQSLEENLNNNNYSNIQFLPDNKISKTDLFNKLKIFNNRTSDNKISGVVYSNNAYDDLVNTFYHKYSKSNPLHADIFPEIRMMEIDIINICKELYKAPHTSCGSLTSGGTESILLSCVTYRDYCKENNNITNPNIIGFHTIHPAFDKACHYFNIKLIKVKNINQMKSNINSNTICLVASAPDYPYGLIDPIKEVNKLALKYSKNLHIDACMGGFLLPFLDKYKYINFTLSGITSISMDTHKYGYSPKGSSVLLFRDVNVKKYQHFISKDWCGGVYATPTMLGSKPGGIIAGTWASLLLRGTNIFIETSTNIN